VEVAPCWRTFFNNFSWSARWWKDDPAPIVAGGGPYLILQRTFYAPLVLSMSVPDQLPAGEYEVHLEVGAQQWETATPLAVTID